MIKRLYSFIKNLIRVSKMLNVDDSGDLRFCTVSSLGKTQKALLFTPYGVMSNPPVSSLALTMSQGGQESNLIVMVDDPKNRPLKNLKTGEFAIGNYLTGDHLYFDENGNLIINITGKITMNAPLIELNGNVAFTGGTVTHDSKNIGDNHIHSGVTTGAGNTGVPV